MTQEHRDFGKVREFIYAVVNRLEGPVIESEIENLVRCALDGGYKFELTEILTAHGAFVAGYSFDKDGNPEHIR